MPTRSRPSQTITRRQLIVLVANTVLLVGVMLFVLFAMDNGDGNSCPNSMRDSTSNCDFTFSGNAEKEVF